MHYVKPGKAYFSRKRKKIKINKSRVQKQSMQKWRKVNIKYLGSGDKEAVRELISYYNILFCFIYFINAHIFRFFFLRSPPRRIIAARDIIVETRRRRYGK